MNRTSAPKSRAVIAALATPVAVVAAGALVYQASYAAFSGQTRNSGNEWSTGSVRLTDDDNGQARFQVNAMKPGDTGSACIKVTADASVPSTVKGFLIKPVTYGNDTSLDQRILMKVEGGQGGTFTNCTGFVPEDGPAVVPELPLTTLVQFSSWESAVGGWSVNPGVSTKTYRFTWRFDTAGMTQAAIDQLQGKKTGVDLQWEMRTDDAL